jgi:hypothetical protein
MKYSPASRFFIDSQACTNTTRTTFFIFATAKANEKTSAKILRQE